MDLQIINIDQIKENPENPRFITKRKFEYLHQSIQEFPKMLEIRPIVVNKDMMILGGNMKFKSLKEKGIKEIPVLVVDFTEEEEKQFIIKDNEHYGSNDWDVLANDWDAEFLKKCGVDIPQKPIEEEIQKPKKLMVKIKISNEDELDEFINDIQDIIDKKYPFNKIL